MTNNSIERMLEINNRVEKGGVATKKPLNNINLTSNQRDFDRIIEQYDKAVYGPQIIQEEKQEKYDPKKEMERLKEIEANGGRSVVDLQGRNIPQEIVESILNNPLDLKPFDPQMDALEEKLRDNMPGIKAAADILERVERQDEEARAKITENLIPRQNTSTNVDYEQIKNIIEEAIDRKLNDFKTTLNENVSRQQPYVPSMKIMNFKDKFYFVDNDNNVFECEMKYKGKRKKK